MKKTAKPGIQQPLMDKLLPVSRNEANHLQAMNIKAIVQLYERNHLVDLQNSPNTAIDRELIVNLS
jgi:hypothetical protein